MGVATFGIVSTLTRNCECENCGVTIEAGDTAKRIGKYEYEHLNCYEHIDLDKVNATKSRHPANPQ